MPRIEPIDLATAQPEVRLAAAEHAERHGRITNMKRTLLLAPPAFHALMQWYTLRDAVRPFLGDRLTTLFAHSVSAESDCLICSTFFRRILFDAGENPDELVLDDRERTVVSYGRQLAADPHGVGNDLYGELARHFAPAEIVALTAFGAIMLATNLFNNALRVELDDYLEPYRLAVGKDGRDGRPTD